MFVKLHQWSQLAIVMSFGFLCACERTFGRSRVKKEFSVRNPNPSLLVWDKLPLEGPTVAEVAEGTLIVHIDPDDLESPKLHLRVKMSFSKTQPSPHSPMLLHCGGPGSGTGCVDNVKSFLNGESVDAWSIDQRGIGANIPAFKCNSAKKDPASEKPSYEVSDFTDCPCALVDGTPLFNDRSVNIDPEDEEQVRNLLKHARLRGQRCYESKKFQIKDNPTEKVYNFLEWSGTQMLAYDIDTMRRAIGADKMSIVGYSYGTQVGAVYASIFPQSTDRLVLNGNMVPIPDKAELAVGAASGLTQAITKLLYNCRTHENCELQQPVETFGEILEDLRSEHGLTANTPSGKPLRLSVGMLIGRLADYLNDADGEGWKDAIALLSRLSRTKTDIAGTVTVKTDSERQVGVKMVLTHACHVKDKNTWFRYGTCIGTGHVAEEDGRPGSDSFIEMNAVLSQDYAGRYEIPDVMRQWHLIKTEYGPVGSTAYLAQMAAMFDWPTIPSPVAPMGNPTVPALVIGNLYDPATPYRWSQQMHEAFPAGAMMTWQGVGHLMTASLQSYDNAALLDCQKHVLNYLKTGKLPSNGHVCRQTTKQVPVRH